VIQTGNVQKPTFYLSPAFQSIGPFTFVMKRTKSIAFSFEVFYTLCNDCAGSYKLNLIRRSKLVCTCFTHIHPTVVNVSEVMLGG
jgi:hypothetical protein